MEELNAGSEREKGGGGLKTGAAWRVGEIVAKFGGR